MALEKTRFLLDENVPRKLLKEIEKRKLDARTVQQKGWSGIKNGELSRRVLKGYFNDFKFSSKKEINCFQQLILLMRNYQTLFRLQIMNCIYFMCLLRIISKEACFIIVI